MFILLFIQFYFFMYFHWFYIYIYIYIIYISYYLYIFFFFFDWPVAAAVAVISGLAPNLCEFATLGRILDVLISGLPYESDFFYNMQKQYQRISISQHMIHTVDSITQETLCIACVYLLMTCSHMFIHYSILFGHCGFGHPLGARWGAHNLKKIKKGINMH